MAEVKIERYVKALYNYKIAYPVKGGFIVAAGITLGILVLSGLSLVSYFLKSIGF